MKKVTFFKGKEIKFLYNIIEISKEAELNRNRQFSIFKKSIILINRISAFKKDVILMKIFRSLFLSRVDLKAPFISNEILKKDYNIL